MQIPIYYGSMLINGILRCTASMPESNGKFSALQELIFFQPEVEMVSSPENQIGYVVEGLLCEDRGGFWRGYEQNILFFKY